MTMRLTLEPTPIQDARQISDSIRRDLRGGYLSPERLERWLALLNVQLSCAEAGADLESPVANAPSSMPAGTRARFYGHLTSIDGGRA